MIFEDINWINGMLISANHLKNIKKVNFYNLFFLIKQQYKFFYGVIKIEFDFSMVNIGIINIISCIVIMEDGSIIDFNMYNNNNEVLSIDLKTKNISNNSELLVYLSSVNYYSPQVKERLYNTTVECEDYLNVKENIEYSKVRSYLNIKEECNANMVSLPLLKIKKYNDNLYSLQDFLYLHFIVTTECKFGKSIINLLNQIIVKSYNIDKQIQEFYTEKYLDYEMFNTIRSYDMIIYDVYSLKNDILNNGVNMYTLYSKLSNVLRKLFSLSNINLIDIQRFSIDNLHDTFKYLIDNIEYTVSSIFYCSVNYISMHKDNNKFIGKYEETVFDKSKLYVQCYYSNLLNLQIVKDEINNMIISSESHIDYVLSNRITGLKRKIIEDFETIKNIIGIVSIKNTITIEIETTNSNFFQKKDNLVIIVSQQIYNKLNFNIIYSKKE